MKIKLSAEQQIRIRNAMGIDLEVYLHKENIFLRYKKYLISLFYDIKKRFKNE